jgi:hypothetical protein
MIAVLSRAGLRVQEARALTEHDLDDRRRLILPATAENEVLGSEATRL